MKGELGCRPVGGHAGSRTSPATARCVGSFENPVRGARLTRMMGCSSCALCRRRKIRCNRETPCSNCVRAKNETCVYEAHISPPPRQHIEHRRQFDRSLAPKLQEPLVVDEAFNTSRESTVSSHVPCPLTTPVGQPSAQDVECMVNRIRQLEEQLSKANLRSTGSSVSAPNSVAETTTSTIGRNTQIHLDPQTVTRSITHKTRVFGKSFWMNAFIFVSIL